MTQVLRQLFSAFNERPKESQREVLLSLLHLPIGVPYTSPYNEELRCAADAVVLEFDRSEARARHHHHAGK